MENFAIIGGLEEHDGYIYRQYIANVKGHYFFVEAIQSGPIYN